MICLIIIIFAALIIEALADVHYGDSHGTVSNLILVATMLSMEAIGLYLGTKMGFLIYAMFRFCTFDYMYSFFRFGNIWYLGKTSLMDRELKRINKYLLISIRIVIIFGLILTLHYA